MAEPSIPITRPWLDEREADAARRAILSGWVTQGPEVAAFESEFAATMGAERACAVSSCTAALHLALRALGAGPGSEVVTVSHSYVATANAIRYCGATPVFVDVEPGGINMDPRRAEAAIGPRTAAILCVHQMGMPCDLAALVELAERHALPLVEDAACAAGSEVRWGGERGDWERIGRPRGVIACFSFHPRKLLTTGDGGMLVTSDEELDRKFRLWRHHGMDVADTVRHGAREVVREHHVEIGYNYRMTDIQAAVGRVQLTRLPEMIERRRALTARYFDLLAGAPIEAPHEPDWARSNWQSFWVRLPSEIDQAAVMQSMLDSGVATRPGIMCAHREPAYADEPWRAGPGGLEESELSEDRTILLPLFPQMTREQQDRVVEALIAAIEVSRVGA